MFVDIKTFIFYNWLSWFFLFFFRPDPEGTDGYNRAGEEVVAACPCARGGPGKRPMLFLLN